MKFEVDVLAALETLKYNAPATPDDVRAVMSARKRDVLLAHRATLKRDETRAIESIRRVEYPNIEPRLVNVAPADMGLWRYLRLTVSAAPFTGRPGRCKYLLCVDTKTRGALGVMEIGSDLHGLGPRDRWIGWKVEQKYRQRGMSHLANMGTCVSVAPFGVLTGGKCMAVLVTSTAISDLWMRVYGDELAMVTTTSLYGRSSQYNRLSQWAYIGNTGGLGMFHITEDMHALFKRFRAANGLALRTHGTAGGLGGKHENLLAVCAALHLDLEQFSSHQPRGVYVAELATNAREYLRGETDVLRRNQQTQDELSAWWLSRWCAMRWPKKREEVRSFDANVYRVDNQIEQCTHDARLQQAITSDQDDSGGATPTQTLHNSTGNEVTG